jgi:hypothetical protein
MPSGYALAGMTVYAVQGTVGFRNAARRDSVMQTVQNRLSQEVTWGETTTQAVVVEAGGRNAGRPDPGMIVEVRFTTATARDAFWDDVVAYMGGGINGPVTGSFIQKHDCPHDGPSPTPCVVSERIDYAGIA